MDKLEDKRQEGVMGPPVRAGATIATVKMMKLRGTMQPKQENAVELSIIAPMYNEESNIESTILSIQEVMKEFPLPWELILVNDGSIDKTLEAAKEWEARSNNLRVLSYPVNIGRGKALRTGLENARGQYIVTIDFDLSYSPDHILKLYHELKQDRKTDVVLGSAYMKGGTVRGGRPIHIFLSKMGNKILEAAFDGKFKTITCVLRGYRRKVVEALVLESDGKEIHLEILSKVVALGFNVKEIPANLIGRARGKSKTKLSKTSISHLLFSIYERPVLLFSAIGFVLLALGILAGLYVAYLRVAGTLNPGRPLLYLVIILILVGAQSLYFGIIAGQNSILRNEIYKLQSRLKMIEKKITNDTTPENNP